MCGGSNFFENTVLKLYSSLLNVALGTGGVKPAICADDFFRRSGWISAGLSRNPSNL